MDQNEMYLTLPSNSSKLYFPGNTLASYKTKLPKTLSFTGHWKVGLTEITYPHMFENVRKNVNDRFYVYSRFGSVDNTAVIRTAILTPGFYNDGDAIVAELNSAVQRVYAEVVGYEKAGIVFRYTANNNKINCSIQEGNRVAFNGVLGEMLGFEAQTTLSPGYHEASNLLDIMMGFYSIFVYSNICQSSIVGDTEAPLLRVVKISGKPGDMVTTTYDRPMYINISQSDFDFVEVNLKDDSGYLINFTLGKVYITLHFIRDFSA